MLDDRAKLLLKVLVERYIADGQPIGSRTLSRSSGLELSPATIRNVMADLEELGLIASPHTSAGRIPTARGYRLFVDTMLTAQRQALVAPQLPAEQPQKVIANAAHLLSNLSQFVGVVMAPKRSSVFKQIEFVKLSERRVLVIIVAPDGDVQNRVMFTDSELDSSQLIEAANYLNSHYAGLDIEQVRERLRTEVEQLRSQVTDLMQAGVNISAEALSPATQEEQVVIAGQSNLLAVSDFSHDMHNLRRAFDLFEQKTQILRLLDFSSQAEGVRIFIGGESHIVPIEELSVVSAPYEVDGQIVGTLGVIGPTRMPYDKMIQIVDITSKLVSNALSHQREPLAMVLTASTACENWRCWMSCSVRDTSTKRRMRGLSVFSWRSSSRAKSAMQRSMPLRSLAAKYAKVSSTSDWQSNSLESSPSIAARDKTRVAVARSPM